MISTIAKHPYHGEPDRQIPLGVWANAGGDDECNIRMKE